jgi:PPOX class probable F420-dependent enzyme
MMTVKISDQLLQRLGDETTAWLTTVRRDGTPQPAPVWFLWEGESFLIYSQPEARKVRNIRENPQVAINFNTDEGGGKVAVFWGRATLEPDAPPADQVKDYVKKYRQAIADIGMTPESMGREYSQAIRIKPERLRED